MVSKPLRHPGVLSQKSVVMAMRRDLVGLAPVKAEQAELRTLAARRSTAQAMALWARIVLACAEGAQNQDVAARLAVSEQTVSEWSVEALWQTIGRLLKQLSP